MDGFLLPSARQTRLSRRRAVTGDYAMQIYDSNSFGLILAGISVAFMLWVLWNFHKAERKQ